MALSGVVVPVLGRAPMIAASFIPFDATPQTDRLRVAAVQTDRSPPSLMACPGPTRLATPPA